MSLKAKPSSAGETLDRIKLIEGAFPAGARAVFTTREGGRSLGPYASLNLGHHVGDDPGAVAENRRIVARRLGLDARDLTCALQTHGAEAALVTAAQAGRGASSWEDGLPADALVTAERGLPLMVVAADCMLVALADADAGAVAAVHASRRSALGGIIGRTVALMRSRLGADPGRMLAVLGPHIGECCYEVSPDVEDEAKAARGPRGGELLVRSPRRTTFSLLRLVRGDLLAEGLPPEGISEAGGCTACDRGKFFSYRRDGEKTGRTALIVYNA